MGEKGKGERGGEEHRKWNLEKKGGMEEGRRRRRRRERVTRTQRSSDNNRDLFWG